MIDTSSQWCADEDGKADEAPVADASLHPTAQEVQEYLEAYATHFRLWSHIKLSTKVIKIGRDEKKQQWLVTSCTTASASEVHRSHAPYL